MPDTTMRRLLVILLALATLVAANVAVAQDEEDENDDGEPLLCDLLKDVTLGSMTGTGSFNNIYMFDQTGNTYCRVHIRDSAFWTPPEEIGIPDMLALAPTQAVDLYGLLPDGTSILEFRSPVRVCLRGEGAIYFLDAADSSRTVTTLFDWAAEDGYSCADVFSAGTVLLAPPPPPPPTPPPDAPADPATAVALTGCTVTTTYGLRLRFEPNTSSRIWEIMRGDIELEAVAKAGNWYQVKRGNVLGWVNASLVSTAGTCE